MEWVEAEIAAAFPERHISGLAESSAVRKFIEGSELSLSVYLPSKAKAVEFVNGLVPLFEAGDISVLELLRLNNESDVNAETCLQLEYSLKNRQLRASMLSALVGEGENAALEGIRARFDRETVATNVMESVTKHLNLQGDVKSLAEFETFVNRISSVDKSGIDTFDEELAYWRQRVCTLSFLEHFVHKEVLEGPLGAKCARGHLDRLRRISTEISDTFREAQNVESILTMLHKQFFSVLASKPLDFVLEHLSSLLSSIRMAMKLSRGSSSVDLCGRVSQFIVHIVCQRIRQMGDAQNLTWAADPKSTCEALHKGAEILNTVLQFVNKNGRDSKNAIAACQLLTACRFRFSKIDTVFNAVWHFTLVQEQCPGPEFKEFRAGFSSLRDSLLGSDQRRDLFEIGNGAVFEQEFIGLSLQLSKLEHMLIESIDQAFSRTYVMVALELFATLRATVPASIQQHLDTKLSGIFELYHKDLLSIRDEYEKNKASPPRLRYFPQGKNCLCIDVSPLKKLHSILVVSSNVAWSRKLLHRVATPMVAFRQIPAVFSHRSSQSVINLHNTLVRVLVEYVSVWVQAWEKSATVALKSGLQAKLLRLNSKTKALEVNFDARVRNVLKEAKHLRAMGFTLSQNASTLLLLSDRIFNVESVLETIVHQYRQLLRELASPVLREILETRVQGLHRAMVRGFVSLNWASVSAEPFTHTVQILLNELIETTAAINRIIQSRIRHSLRSIASARFVSLPVNTRFSPASFTLTQQQARDSVIEQISEAMRDIAGACEDLAKLSVSKQEASASERTADFDHHAKVLQRYYSGMIATATRSSVTQSLRSLEKHLGSGIDLVFHFELSVKSKRVVFSPDSSKIAACITNALKDLFSSLRQLDGDWQTVIAPGVGSLLSEFAFSGRSVLATALSISESTKRELKTLESQLTIYEDFAWLFEEPDSRSLCSKETTTHKFVESLARLDGTFEAVQSIIHKAQPNYKTDSFISNIRSQLTRWKSWICASLNDGLRLRVADKIKRLEEWRSGLNVEIGDLSALNGVMKTLADVREAAVTFDEEFSEYQKQLSILEGQDFEGKVPDDLLSVAVDLWAEVENLSIDTREHAAALQLPMSLDLKEKMRSFSATVRNFRADFEKTGPLELGIPVKEAINRFKKCQQLYDSIERNADLYSEGERLFGFEQTQYPELDSMAHDLKNLGLFYGVYEDVLSRFGEFEDVQWMDVIGSIDEMKTATEEYSLRCRRLNKEIKSWPQFEELRNIIKRFEDMLPLIAELSKESVRFRHWESICGVCSLVVKSPEDLAELRLKALLDSDFAEQSESVEEILDSADKQLQIERRLDEIEEIWTAKELEFTNFKTRGEVILSGGVVTEVTEGLEDAQASLVQMLSMKHIAPFHSRATEWLQRCSDANDVIEMLVRIQMLWMALEPVFTAGDIARQLPQDTRVFQKSDKEWVSKLMAKAKELKTVVAVTSDEYVTSALSSMMSDFEQCQRSLEGYLEKKRDIFPRFYFVSNSALLQILSSSSDLSAVNSCFSKVFDAITKVTIEGDEITKFWTELSGYGGAVDAEIIPLTRKVSATGNIEDWLNVLEREMRRTMRRLVFNASNEAESNMDVEEFTNRHSAQCSLLGLQLLWTEEITRALKECSQDKTALTRAMDNQSAVLSALSEMTTTTIPTKLVRTKIETMVTIQVHNRDVLAELCQLYKEKKVSGAADFEWQKQLRVYWDEERQHCFVNVADNEFPYCYEFLGCKERLVITPLTDRCYISLTQALGMYFGGAPAGPAGTGKTETVKDLGRALGKYVVVFNCSDQMRHGDTAKIFKGLCCSGSWGCFDEFNRIPVEVLSVVATQLGSILTAMRAREEHFVFPGTDAPVMCNDNCGFFITMNPGYAGRTELPENLKALFRDVAMMVPDREIIMRVKLASQGFSTFALLAQKFKILYGLCEEQLSKQRHYDFGLRNILSVLRTAGASLRDELALSTMSRSNLEASLLYRTLRDMNLSKLVADDVPLFLSLLADLFPTQRNPAKATNEVIEQALVKKIQADGLVAHQDWMDKIIQLHQTSLVRHGLMMIGPTGTGKTTAVNCLLGALSECSVKHVEVRMFPKAIRAEEMFGENDEVSGEWRDGVFSVIWSRYNDSRKTHNTWIVCDGPVDAVWIENLNTVLDDNKLLTLANGDRVPMTSNVRILFEAEDLRNASPATVSRAGIVFVSEEDLGYRPLAEAWCAARSKKFGEAVLKLYKEIVEDTGMLAFVRRSCDAVMQVTDAHLIKNLFTLFEGIIKKHALDTSAKTKIRSLFLWSVLWSIGGLFEHESQAKFSEFLKKTASDLPEMSEEETLYDFFVDPERDFTWHRWEAPNWEFPANFEFASCLIPTCDSEKAQLIFKALLNVETPTLLIGSVGTGKSSIVSQFGNRMLKSPDSNVVLKEIQFSSATTQKMFQVSIESDIEKRQGKTYSPPSNKIMLCFLDDLSQPEVNVWGDQPTLEIVRQLISTKGFYFLDERRGDKMEILNLRFAAAMCHPGGGRNDIPNRLKRLFFTFNQTPPSHGTIDNIYGVMLQGQFASNEAVLENVSNLTTATIELWKRVQKKMLPTPANVHYYFNLRDLSRVFQGILFVNNEDLKERSDLFTLWMHESQRAFHDKLSSHADQAWFTECQQSVAREFLGVEDSFFENKRLYADFFREDIIDKDTDEVVELAPKIYEGAPEVHKLRERIDSFLVKYNNEPKLTAMNLVLFEDAILHLMRISRILSLPRGNAMLVGVGGSGRQSLTRLAGYIARHEVCRIQRTRTYKAADFLEDLKSLCIKAGKEGKKVTFIFSDSDIVSESFLEYLNALLSTGEVAGLFPKDERDLICAELRPVAMKEDPNRDNSPRAIYRYFIQRVRANLHVVLCFSPGDPKFGERARKFPALFSCCTIDWFLPWPQDALDAVAERWIGSAESFAMHCTDEQRKNLVHFMSQVHLDVVAACQKYKVITSKRTFVTPKSFLSFLGTFKQFYTDKLHSIAKQEVSVSRGLGKLSDASRDVENMKLVLADQKIELQKAEKETTAVLEKLEVGAKEASLQKDRAAEIEEQCTRQAQEIEEQKEIANTELLAALPFMEAATEAAKSVNKADIGVIAKLPKPPDLIKRIMDCVLILMQQPLEKVEEATISVKKEEAKFILDSYKRFALPFMSSPSFVPDLLNFSLNKKDFITEETMELLEPYLDVPDFEPEFAKNVSSAAEGLCRWCRAMFSYHKASLIVAPKLAMLREKEAELSIANKKLAKAQSQSAAAQKALDDLQHEFEQTMAKKAEIESSAKSTAAKSKAAENLIASLEGERIRWTNDAKRFADTKRKLIGDCAVACAFISYCGPFNYTFRDQLVQQSFIKKCKKLEIPHSLDLRITKFCVDDSIAAEWNSQGLPTDELSVQNGLLVTNSDRPPLIIDPQSQAMTWLRRRESANFPAFGTTTISNPKLRDQLEFCLSEGLLLLVDLEDESDIDPLLLNLNKIQKGRRTFVQLGTEFVECTKGFKMIFVSKLDNPAFTAETFAAFTVVDFSVTREGLEDQILSLVIGELAGELEEQRTRLVTEVNMLTISLIELDRLLLERLSASEGNLLEDTALISVLGETKTKAVEVEEKIESAKNTEKMISRKREQYRSIAARGSVLYFVVSSLARVNCMYASALQSTVAHVKAACGRSDPQQVVSRRALNIIRDLTYSMYVHTDRSLFAKDKVAWRLLLALTISLHEKQISAAESNVFLKGGSTVATEDLPKNAFSSWLPDASFANAFALSQSVDFYKDVLQVISGNEKAFRHWYEKSAPEECEIPVFDARAENFDNKSFLRLLFVRCIRPDRVIISVDQFVEAALGEDFVKPLTHQISDVVDSKKIKILVLTPGADPTEDIRTIAKRAGLELVAVSMGEGQAVEGRKAIRRAMTTGNWALLSNGHLGLDFISELEAFVKKLSDEITVADSFRLWITSEPSQKFPISLLQAADKITVEAPTGLRANLHTIYNTIITKERLDRVDRQEWKVPEQQSIYVCETNEMLETQDAAYTISWLHAVVLERRKFGPIGFAIPYSFSPSDLEMCLNVIEKHMYMSPVTPWETLKYQIASVQYGGKVTDGYDGRLMRAIGERLLTSEVVTGKTPLVPQMKFVVPKCDNIEGYRTKIDALPSHAPPPTFGLHNNADLVYGTSKSGLLLQTIRDLQPKDTTTSDEASPEQIVVATCERLLNLMPNIDKLKEEIVRERIRTRPREEIESMYGKAAGKIDGFSVPLNIFLFQECVLLERTMRLVESTLKSLLMAIEGTVVMTSQLAQAFEDISVGDVVRFWYIDAAGMQIAWRATSLNSWFKGVIDRYGQLTSWLYEGRPTSFWLTGFYNPQGFCTATLQEITRKHKAERWALDDVALCAEVTEIEDPRNVKQAPDEGVYIRGLFIEGACWDSKNKTITEARPRELFPALPVIHLSGTLHSRQFSYLLQTYVMQLCGTVGTATTRAKLKLRSTRYECPVYTSPKRTDLSFVTAIHLPTTTRSPAHWIERGVAILCSTE